MIPFLIKSTICLIVSFGIYKFLLQNLKAHVFNRFYLVFSLLFALVIPFISFQTKVDLPVNAGIEKISNYTENYVFSTEIKPIEIKKENISVTQVVPQAEFHWQYVLYALYFLVSLVLMFRFVLNLFRIFRTIEKNEKIDFQQQKLVLVPEKILPYSFFHFIFLNKEEYESGEIGNQLLAHECTHCRQLHTLDILLVETLKIVFWFNPALWLYRKAIQLNHEFLADESVVKKHELIDYQKLLLKIVFRNNSTYLASNFNYSLIKKRLKMMTTKNSVKKTALRTVLALTLVAFVMVTMAFQKQIKHEVKPLVKNEVKNDTVKNYEKEWWYQILKKENIELKKDFKVYGSIFVMGENETQTDSGIILKNPVLLYKGTHRGGNTECTVYLGEKNIVYTIQNGQMTAEIEISETKTYILNKSNWVKIADRKRKGFVKATSMENE